MSDDKTEFEMWIRGVALYRDPSAPDAPPEFRYCLINQVNGSIKFEEKREEDYD